VKIVGISFVLFVTILVEAFGVAIANGATPTPLGGTPTSIASATPMPTQASGVVPAAPSGAHIDLRARRVSWLDNSKDEAGFRVTIRAASVDVGTFTVAANLTSFDIPDAAFDGGCGQSIVVSIVAFNDNGSSAPSVDGVAADCGPSPTSAPPATPRLPGTGTGRASSQSIRGALMFLLLGSSMLMVGLTLSPWPRIRRRRDAAPRS